MFRNLALVLLLTTLPLSAAENVSAFGPVARANISAIGPVAIANVAAIGAVDNTGGGGPPGSPVQQLDASTVTGSDGDPISTWTATVGKNATSAGSARPTLQTAEQNGLNVLSFDGVDDTMITSAFDANLTQPCVIFFVFKLGTAAVTQRAFSSRVDEGGDRNMVRFDSAPSYQGYGGSAFVNIWTATDPNTSWHIMSVEFNGTDTKARVDGGTEEDNNPALGTTGIYSGLSVSGDYDGSVNPCQIMVGEILMYSGTIADKTDYFNYLNDKWAVY